MSAESKLYLDCEHALKLLRAMLRTRRFEENSGGFLHLYMGEEAVTGGVMQGLNNDAAVVASCREHGQASAQGLPMNTFIRYRTASG
jgi:pyruvate dehydrogenase E1 component alpha subunit